MQKSFEVGPVSGENIINAGKELSGDNFMIKSEYIEGKEVFSIGQKSRHSSGSFIIQVDGGNWIDPEKQYKKISVEDFHWDGVLIDSDGQAVVGGVVDFSARLEKGLMEKSKK
jgi:hypothetical protein